MLETTRLLLTEITRNLFKKMQSSPVLYTFFSAMILFSVVMFAFLTFFLLHTKTTFNFMDVFFSVFFLFLLKSASDLHNYFITAPQLSYALSTSVAHRRTIGEIVFGIVLINTGLWFVFSLLYLLVLAALRISIDYPVDYLLISINVVSAILLGCTLSLHFFSSYRYRLIPTLLLLIFCWFSQSLVFIACMAPLVVLHVMWSVSHPLDSYRFVQRKERTKECFQARVRSPLLTIFYREITVMWRERLFFSFVSMSVFTALGTGYFYLYGTDVFIPASIQKMIGGFLPTLFVFLGIYVVTMYTAVFPGLNLFLTEEKTMWILRHLPVADHTIVYGKTLALSLCFLTTLPFLAFIPVFLGADDLVFLFWFLVFSFLAAVIIAVPLGVKYVGKKSDILLLYSVAMILFIILSCAGAAMNFLRSSSQAPLLLLCLLLLAFEAVFLFLSLKISTWIVSKPSPNG